MTPHIALSELRAATRAEHDRIEHLLRLDAPMPLARYAAVVAGFEAFLRAWEPRLEAALPDRLRAWYRPRRRADFAAADAAWLRSVGTVAALAPDVRDAAALPLDDVVQAMGSLYVIEGSALGGRVIGPQLERTLALSPGRGASYFHGFGDETGPMWADFRRHAAHEIGDAPADVARACDSARRTFAALLAVFAPLASAAPAVADIHIDLAPDGAPESAPSFVELPMDDAADDGDTLRMPL